MTKGQIDDLERRFGGPETGGLEPGERRRAIAALRERDARRGLLDAVRGNSAELSR